MIITKKPAQMREQISTWHDQGGSVALVPTMGGLHDGHFSLIQKARESCSYVVATIFVNPKQFGPTEDFKSYPRQEKIDAENLAAYGVDMLYIPQEKDFYPKGFTTQIQVPGLDGILCGAHRPQFLTGVATVVTKLFLQVMPDAAFFGEKDFQQLQVIRRMVEDLGLPVFIAGCPTMREKDGLAMSSRNMYLSDAERQIAPLLYKAIKKIALDAKKGVNLNELIAQAKKDLIKNGFQKIDYIEARHEDDLSLVESLPTKRKSRVFAAAFLGKTRLIDNVKI